MKKPNLSKLKKVMSTAVIHKFVSMSPERVKELREVYGRSKVHDGLTLVAPNFQQSS